MKYQPYELGLAQPGKNYITMNGLINRGWTQWLIERLLREPCKTVQHPRWSSPASVWHVDRVRDAEKTTVFQLAKKSPLQY